MDAIMSFMVRFVVKFRRKERELLWRDMERISEKRLQSAPASHETQTHTCESAPQVSLSPSALTQNQVTEQTFSYFDTGKGPSGDEPERFYHGFVLGMVVELAEQYQVKSNRESGYGRDDVMLERGLFKKCRGFYYFIQSTLVSHRRQSRISECSFAQCRCVKPPSKYRRKSKTAKSRCRKDGYPIAIGGRKSADGQFPVFLLLSSREPSLLPPLQAALWEPCF